MTPKEFFNKVVEMRRCQKEYFKNKRQIDLIAWMPKPKFEE